MSLSAGNGISLLREFNDIALSTLPEETVGNFRKDSLGDVTNDLRAIGCTLSRLVEQFMSGTISMQQLEPILERPFWNFPGYHVQLLALLDICKSLASRGLNDIKQILEILDCKVMPCIMNNFTFEVDPSIALTVDLAPVVYGVMSSLAEHSIPDFVQDARGTSVLDDDRIQDFATFACSSLCVLWKLLSKLEDIASQPHHLQDLKSGYHYGLKRAAPLIYVAMVTHTGTHKWTTSESLRTAHGLRATLFAALKCPNIRTLLCGSSFPLSSEKTPLLTNGILSDLGKIYEDKFNRKNWREHLALRHCLVYTITQLKYPDLHKDLSFLVPALLLLCDDYQVENKVLGIATLSHVLLNVNASDLNLHNHGDVIYDALYKHLYSSDNPVLEVVLPCLLKTLKLLESKLSECRVKSYRKIDTTFQQVLYLLEMESKLITRRTLLRNIKDFVEVMGISITRHIQRLLRALFECLKYYDGEKEEARVLTLRILERLVIISGPVMKVYGKQIIQALLTLLISIPASDITPMETRNTIFECCERILYGVRNCFEGELDEELIRLKSAEVCDSCLYIFDIVDRVLSKDLIPILEVKTLQL